MSVRSEVQQLMDKKLAVLQASFLARIEQEGNRPIKYQDVLHLVAGLADIQGQAILKLATEIDKLAE